MRELPWKLKIYKKLKEERKKSVKFDNTLTINLRQHLTKSFSKMIYIK